MSSTAPFRQVGTPGRGAIVCVCDHASNHVPADIELGISPELLAEHIAVDIGTEAVVENLVSEHGMAAHLATISRLVCDLHREEDHPAMIPHISDGHVIPGNSAAGHNARLERFHRPYHSALAQWLDAAEPALILSIHSFTPRLATSDEARPWQVGLLYNRDDRAARHAIAMFAAEGFVVGDNQPYSGRDLNYTMNRHAEAHGRPYLAIEIRQDQISNSTGQQYWARLVADIARRVALKLG
ncbi:MAG: N-formylglutamate amidohydrolase [Erythrobacter sp.]